MLAKGRGDDRVFMIGYPVSYETLAALYINGNRVDLDIYVKKNLMSKSRRIFGVTRSMIRAMGLLREYAEAIYSSGHNIVVLAEKPIDGRHIGGSLADLAYFFYDANSSSYVRFDNDVYNRARIAINSLQNFVNGILGDPEDIARDTKLHILLKQRLLKQRLLKQRKEVDSYARGT